MAEVAGIILPPFLQLFFDRMASQEFVDFFRRRKLNDGLLMRLKMTLLSVNEVLEDAEDKQFTKPDVKEWLDELKDALYDAEDILDEIPTKDLRQKLDAEFGTIASKVRIASPISASRFVKKVERKIEELLKRLKFLVEQKENIGLRQVGNPSERLPTTSFIEESSICGRDYDKEEIINLLLLDDTSGSEIGVIAIVGMGGIGKTTLAQLVYNDNRVKEHFDLEVWVCISDPFDVFIVMKTILEEVGSYDNADSRNLNQLQTQLKETLTGKKFLLVLDDVWEKSYFKWEVLSNAFKSGAQGSKVIVTTRDQEVASVMFASVHRIMELPEEDSLLLFAKHAFHDGNFDAHPELEAIGRQIVEKCKGLPLAIKAIGALLRSKINVDGWDKVLRSELWDLPIEETDILPALGLSYKYLSSNLKRCFAYCSILPKDYAFKKDKLVLLWMAEGFLPQPKNKTMEEVGDDYFLALVSRSLFQQSNHDEYIMHDLVRDLAKFISKQFALSVEDGSSHEIGSKTRHFSYSCEHTHIKKFEALHRAKRLRTIVELHFFGDDLSHMFGTQFFSPMIRCLRLRVLILSHYTDITELPDSIGKLIYLRYLDLSFTAIKRLPHFICKLCNLQTLNLSHCPYLTAWPRDMHKLINLRHLDFAENNIMGMPINLGELKCLQTLTSFIVSKHNGSCIGELGKLTNLRGSLPILELQNVESPVDAKDGCLRDVKYLEKLILEWKVGFFASESHVTVLDSLQAHTHLKSLVIYGYGGKSFPNWVGHASFSNITSLRLDYCNHCCSLPPLGQLPSLQDLSVVGLNEVVKMGREFYGSGSSSIKPFGALKVLSIKYMLKWEEWFSFENEGGAFPNLRELEIYECPMLTRGLPVHLPSLAKLKIRDCPQLVASALCELEIPTHLDHSSLEYLMLDGCDSLKSVPLDLFPKLRRLEIRFCGNLESLRVREQHEHDLLLSLIHIDIHGCPKFAYFPKEGLRSPNLKEFRIENCRGIRSLPDKMHILLPSLAKLYIQDCPEVESFPEGGLPSNLEEITILDCEKLFARRIGWDLQNLPSVRIFKVIGKSEDVESFPNEGLLPTSLIYLYINGFQNLRSLDKKGLQHLNALEELEIESCPELECMPEDGLPASLSTLNICNCPLLEKEWERKGEEWRKIAHVPHKSVNFQLIY